MSDESPIDDAAPTKKSKLPIILGGILLLIGSGAGFTAVKLGLIAEDTPDSSESHNMPTKTEMEAKEVAFLPLDPIIVTISDGQDTRLVRFTTQLDVNPQYLSEIEIIKPRIVDILNGYLRAVEIEDLEAVGALTKLRSQMLHRVRIITGDNRVNDLLVMEFIIN